jgi:hypothetical protein
MLRMRKAMVACCAALGLLQAGTAGASVTGIPVYDDYNGPRCFKFWVRGSLQYYALNLDLPWQLNMAAAIRTAAVEGKTVTLFLWGDLALPLQTTYAQNAACFDGDGTSIAVYPTVISLQVHQ